LGAGCKPTNLVRIGTILTMQIEGAALVNISSPVALDPGVNLIASGATMDHRRDEGRIDMARKIVEQLASLDAAVNSGMHLPIG
jgi:hypothetical protein